MKRSISFEDIGHIRQMAWVLPAEKIGAARDTIKASKELTARQWVNIYESAANADNLATDALEILFDYRPSAQQSNTETVYRMTANLLELIGQEVESLGGVEFLKRIGKAISTRNMSMHRASVIDQVGDKDTASAALVDAEKYVAWVQKGIATVLKLDAQGRPLPRK